MVRRLVPLALSFTLLISPATFLDGRAAAGAAPAVPVDGGWPRTYTTDSGARLVLYEPQVDSWADQKRMVMYAAASYTANDRQTPALGTLRIESDTKISRENRLVDFSELTIAAANFPTLSLDQLAAAVAEIKSSVPRHERVIGLDRVLAAIDAGQVKPRNADGVKADPPVMFYSKTPAVLVNIDGDPIWRSTKDDLLFAVNTNWDLFQHMPSSSYYLRIDGMWMTAASIDGPWALADRRPDVLSKLPDDGDWRDARAAAARQATIGRPPAVFVSRKPAELIQLRGAPVYIPVPGTGLQWVSNSDSDIFRAGKAGAVYYLVSGRWFSAPDFKGPWTFVTPTLPDDFKKIPADHPRSHVLASVPGTTQALEAVLLAQVRQTARVSRAEIAAPEVVYQGEPQFQPIEQATVARAVNTDKDVLKIGPATSGDLAHYYLCYDGVWFVSRSATGPWTLAESIPEAIYTIPSSSPAYAVTHVTVDSADDQAVVYAADAAYTGISVAWGCAVWGTGWYYPPYVGWSGRAPVYYRRSGSYGYGALYDPRNSSYARAGAAYGPYRRVAWGPGGDIYGRWGSTAVEQGDQWAKTSRLTNRATSATSATAGRGGAISRRGPQGGVVIGQTDSGNVFAGHDGNVYRNQSGSWQKYESGRWSTVGRGQVRSGAQQNSVEEVLSTATRDQLNHDFAARRAGNRRMTDAGSSAGR